MDKTNIKIVIRSINELKEHLDSDTVQQCIFILKSINDDIKNKKLVNSDYKIECGTFDSDFNEE